MRHMEERDYRAWLAERGDKKNTINTSISTINGLSACLDALGLTGMTLNHATTEHEFETIDQALQDLLTDLKNGGERFRLVAPNTSQPASTLHAIRSHLRKYRRFVFNDEPNSDWKPLERLKTAFLRLVPNFENFEQTINRYYQEERAYKQEILDNYSETLRENLPPSKLGEALYNASRSKGGGLLLRWQTKKSIEDDHPELAPRFLSTLGDLARNITTANRDAIWQAAEQLQSLREAGIPRLTHGEIWCFAFTVAGLAAPDKAAPFKISIARRLASELLGKQLFQGNAPHREDMEAWLDLLERIYLIMEHDWSWRPKDLIDVQGFLWMVGNNDNTEKENDSSKSNTKEGLLSSAASPQNLILYGPPGTGKTWSTRAAAVKLCDGVASKDDAQVIERYESLKDSGQIEFITFHQSYAYEEFVEGLRPVTESESGEGTSTGGFSLQTNKGIFRRICDLAEEAQSRGASEAKFELGERRVFKMSLGRAGVEDDIFEQCLTSNVIGLGWGGEEDWSDPRYRDFQDVRKRWNELEPGTSGSSGNIAQTWRFREMNLGDLVVVTEGNLKFRAVAEITSDYMFRAVSEIDYPHQRRVNWLKVLDTPLPADTIYRKRFSQASCYKFDSASIRKEALARLLSEQKYTTQSAPDQFVLIIDEINRANISKVFGELITLIEPDKRVGQPNALKVNLPYSGDSFGVPNNLHILATMNTADRSIALLDTALRRRFTFQELMPDPELLDKASEASGVDLVALLNTLNDRIEYLYDREHQIGHAYFMHCRSLEDVNIAFQERVIPLLKEYFYEDWEKVAVALGDPNGEIFLERQKLHPPPGLDGYDEDRWRWSVRSEFAPNAYKALT